MEERNRSVPLEDDRFLDAKIPKKKKLHHSLHWFYDEEYFTDEILVVTKQEVQKYKEITEHVFNLFVETLDELVKTKDFDFLNLPEKLVDLIVYSWENKNRHPFFYGRFDVNGILNKVPGKVIEFNADTCSTVPETLVWQPHQLFNSKHTNYTQFNDLEDHMVRFFEKHKEFNGPHRHMILGSSLGYEEDRANSNVILDLAFDANWSTFYADLPEVVFDRSNGIYIERLKEFYKADFFFKFFPWDWIFFDEPELGDDLHHIITHDLCTVLNPAYTHVWQNKLFLARLTERYPNDLHLAKTYFDETPLAKAGYARKPILGRIGENIKLVSSTGDTVAKSKGDYGDQDKVYQELISNPVDDENYHYQAGVFVTDEGAAALNFRTAELEIITDDCEFMTHCYMG